MTKAKREYSLSDSELMIFASNLVGFMTRDAVQFAERGVTAAMITAFEALGNAFEVFPEDDFYKAQITAESEAKSEKRSSCFALVQKISGFFDQKWGVNSWEYKQLGIKGLINLSDDSFLRKCRSVVEIATDNLATLTPIGLNQTMITELEDEAQLMEDKINSVNMKTALREKKSQERIEKGNEVYSYVRKYTNIGKLIWENVSEADYDDYVIYKASPDLPTKVQNLQYDLGVTKLKWDPAANADTYQLEMRRNGPTFSWATIYDGDELEFIFSPPTGEWLFRCRGVNSNGSGAWSNELPVVV